MDANLISTELHELNYLLRKWDKRCTQANRALLVDALAAFRAETGSLGEVDRHGFCAYAGRRGLAATLEPRKLTKPFAAQPRPTSPVTSTAELAAAVNSIVDALGLSGLAVEIDAQKIEAMRAGGVAVDYPAAVEAALTCFTTDGSLSESPVWIVNELALDYGLSESADQAAVTARVKELMRLPGTSLRLYAEAEDPNDEWAGVVMCEQTGERYRTSSHWIFALTPSQFTDENTAVVDKQTGETVCWGFS